MQFAVGLAQIAVASGNVAGNLDKHLAVIEQARDLGTDLLLFPELSLTGVDLFSHMPAVARSNDSAEVRRIAEAAADMDVVIGFVEDAGDGAYHNALAYFSRGRLSHVHRKIYLVSADPVNERRFFTEGRSMSAFDTRFGRVAILNCEDAWHLGPAYLAMLQGATILLTCAATPSGPPTQLPDAELWLTVNRAYAVLLEVFNLFVNRAGDEGTMRFCGSSHAIGPRGDVRVAAEAAQEGVIRVVIDTADVASQRDEVSYVRDERAAFTAHGLNRILGERGGE
jgi:predicted amidohydrolase